MKKVLLVPAVIALACVYFFVQDYGYNSDNISGFLNAAAMVSGNIFLKGWTLTTISYYTTDNIFYALAMLLLGKSEVILFLVPAIFYALTVLVGSIAFSIQDNGKCNINKVWVIIIFSFGVTLFLRVVYLHAMIHNGAIMFSLICLLLLRLYLIKGSKSLLIAFFILNTYNLVGDTLAGFFYIVPALGVVAILVARQHMALLKARKFLTLVKISLRENTKELRLVFALIIPIFLSKMILAVIALLDGFKIGGYGSLRLVNIRQLDDHIIWYAQGMLKLFGFEPSMPVVHYIAAAVIMLVFFLLLAVLIYRQYRNPSFLGLLAIVSFALMTLGCISTKKFDGILAMRYIVPSFILLKFAIGAVAFDILKQSKFAKVAVIIVLLANIMVLPPFQKNVGTTEHHQIPQLLHENGLTNGYGTYWNATVNIVASGFKNRVASVETRGFPNEGAIFAHLWDSDREWYNEPANFLIADSDNTHILTLAAKQFGEPAKVLTTEDKTVFVWNNDISDKLRRVYIDLKRFARVRDVGGVRGSWGRNGSYLIFNNPFKETIDVELAMDIHTAHNQESKISLSGLTEESVNVPADGLHYVGKLSIPYGRHKLIFKSSAPRAKIKGEPILSRFRISNITYK